MDTINELKNSVHNKDFLEECYSAFGFLIDDYGFTKSEVKVDKGLVYILFFKKEIAVECILDEREDNVSVKIIRLENGKKPDVYKKNDSGKVVREYLTQLLIRRGIRDLKFEETEDMSRLSKRRANYRKSLAGYARLLREYAQDVLDGSSEIFDETKE